MIKMRGNKVGVEKLAKASQAASFIALPEDLSSSGRVLYVGPLVTEVRVGMLVYFGDKRQQVKIEGKDIQVMDEDNVLAISE